MCFGIRILSPFHLAILILPIENYKYPKNVQNACADALIGLSCGQFSSKDMAEVIFLFHIVYLDDFNKNFVLSMYRRHNTISHEWIWECFAFKCPDKSLAGKCRARTHKVVWLVIFLPAPHSKILDILLISIQALVRQRHSSRIFS